MRGLVHLTSEMSNIINQELDEIVLLFKQNC